MWKLLGTFPTTFDAGQLNYGSPDKKMVSSTLSVDKALPIRGTTTVGKDWTPPAAGSGETGS